MIRVFTPNKEIIGNLIAYSELSKETGISETATLRFRAPLESAHLLKYEGLVQYKRGKEWIIKELVKDPEWLEVICKEYHPGLDAWIENQAWITQTAKLMLTELLDGTGVVLDMPDYTEKRTVTGSNLSKKELMFKVIDAFGLESTITDSNTLVVRKTLGEDRGAYATDELNLQSLVTAGDTYDFATRIEPRGRDGMTIAEVNGGLTYLDDNSYSDRVITVYWEDNRYTDKMSLKADALKKLEVLAKPLISYKALILDLARGDENSLFFYALGDSMTLLSSKTNERIQQRIVAIKEYLEEPWRNVATLANRPRTVVNQEVEDLKANYEWVKTSIEQLDDELKLKVSSEEYQLDKESNESRFTVMSSEITQTKEGLAQRVTKEEILTDLDIQASLKGDPGPPGTKGDKGDKGDPGQDVDPAVLQEIEDSIDEIKSTGHITPAEKQHLLIKLAEIVEEKQVYEASDVATESEKWSDYDSASSALMIYLNGIVADMSATTTIDPTDLKTKLDSYHASLELLRKSIEQHQREALLNLTKRMSDAELVITADAILQVISSSELYETKIESDASRAELEENFAQLLERTSSLETNINGFTSEVTSRLTENAEIVEEITSYLKFENGVLKLGNTLEMMYLQQQNDRLSFMNGDLEEAYFSNKTLYVDEVVTTRIALDRYELIGDANVMEGWYNG